MFQVSPEDVLRGLKRFKRLAKQDLLASSKTSNPRYWSLQAEARRQTYDLLMNRIEHEGLDAAYEMARRMYTDLPVVSADSEKHAETKGKEQALELFFGVLGLDQGAIDGLRQERRERQLTGDTPIAVNAR